MSSSDLISTIGVTLILAAFFLSTFNVLGDKTRTYFVLNLLGGAFACWGSALIPSWPFVVLEGIWAVVAAFGLVRVLKPQSDHNG